MRLPLAVGCVALPLAFAFAFACSSSSGGGGAPPQDLGALEEGRGLLVDGASLIASSKTDIVRFTFADGTRSVLASDQYASTVLTDGSNLYWGNAYASAKITRSEIVKLPRAGGAVSVLAPGPAAHGIATDGSFVYWAHGKGDQQAAIARVPVGGGAAETVVPNTESYALAVDDTRLYFSNGYDIDVVAKGGGAPSVLAKDVAGTGGVSSIVVAGEDLVFLSATGGGVTANNLKVMPRAGGEARVLSPRGCRRITGIAVDGRDVYATCTGEKRDALLSRVSLDGGEATTLAAVPPEDGSQTSTPSNPVVDATSIYFAASGRVYRVAK